MASRGKGKDDHEPAEPLVTMARGLAEIVAEHNLSELILDTKEVTLTVRRGGTSGAGAPVLQQPQPMAMTMPMPVLQAPAPAPQPAAASAFAPAAAHAVDDKAHVVTSPFVGTFYRKPNPDSPNYVQQGDKIDKGQVLCIVEAMKLMNEIEADVAGTIVGILVEDGQPLFRIAT